MEKPTTISEEEKLIALYKEMQKLERKKRKRLTFYALTIFGLSLCFYILLHYINLPINSIEPDNTSIDLSYQSLSIICTIVGIFLLGIYFSTKEIKYLLIVPLLILTIKNLANPVLHFFYEIDSTQYQNVKIVLKNNPQLISILPNYVNEKCEMNSSNYEKLTELASMSHSSSLIANLPIKKTIDGVKKMCALTVYR